MSELCHDDLFRRLSSKPQFIDENGNPASSIFKDSRGVSVNLAGNRSLEMIIEAEQMFFNKYNRDSSIWLRAILKVTMQVCNDAGVIVRKDPLPDNANHALILGSVDCVQLNKKQARYLAKNSEIIIRYD